MKSIFLTIALLSFASAGCARIPGFNPFPGPRVQAPGPSFSGLAWARNDGQLISGSPDLEAQARTDISECGAAIPPVRTRVGVTGEACMNERGYYVRETS